VKRGNLVRLKNEFQTPMEFGVPLYPHPESWGGTIGYFEGTHVGILLDSAKTQWTRKIGGMTDPIEFDSSLVLVGDCVGWVDTIDLEGVL